ncbi:MAG: endonuclease III domain-containing protein [Bacilli bacterium]
MNEIVDYLNIKIPNPICELNYSLDYELLIAVMFSAQTTDKRVNTVTYKLFKEYDSLDKLKDANLDNIINLVRPLGSYNRKSMNVIEIARHLYEDCNCIVPNNRTYLETLPGVGRKTTNVVLNILFNEQCVAVDTHVARVSIRLGIAKKNDNVLVIEKKITKKFKNNDLGLIHHQLLLFGRYYCKAIKPLCEDCGLKDFCKEKKRVK